MAWGEDFNAFEHNVGRFMSEYGMQSFPDLKTIDLFCDQGKQNLESDIIKSHQKASLGNGNVEKYVDMYFPSLRISDLL